MISKDCESTGTDRNHGARPFLFTACQDGKPPVFWSARVNPLTREPMWEPEVLRSYEQFCNAHDEWVYQSGKFDIPMERVVGVQHPDDLWDRVEDTVISGHLLESNMPHNLTDMSLQYLGVDIKPLEDALEEAVKECRRYVQMAKLKQSKRGIESPYWNWAIAEKGRPDMPSARDKTWRYDYWLPKEMAMHMRLPDDHPWHHVLINYACADAEVTLPIWKIHKEKMQKLDLWDIYCHVRRRLPEIVTEMERGGVTVSKTQMDRMMDRFRKGSDEAAKKCIAIAAKMGYTLTLPKSGNNNSLAAFCFGDGTDSWLDLPVVAKTDSGAPSLDAEALDIYRKELPLGDALEFIQNLRAKRKQDTSITYLESYKKFWLPGGRRDGTKGPDQRREVQTIPSQVKAKGNAGNPGGTVHGSGMRDGNSLLRSPQANVGQRTGTGVSQAIQGRPSQPGVLPVPLRRPSPGLRRGESDPVDFYTLFGSFNPTGTGTLRFTMSNPNTSQVSKQDDYNLREGFVPDENCELWTFDFENVELRVPGYESNEKKMVELFEKPNEPPYFGSYHLLNASIIYPDEFWPLADKQGAFKEKYKATLYQWIKNFGFAFSYGCGQRTGDRTAHKKGAYEMVRHNLQEHTKLNNKYIALANRYGYVETIPDRTVNPRRGYPLWCSKEFGRISPTVPLCYHVSGTAMQATVKAMIRTHDQCKEWQADGFNCRMVLQVHDELIFQMPKGGARNLPRARKLKQLMEESGRDISIPLRVAMGYHPVSWAKEAEAA